MKIRMYMHQLHVSIHVHYTQILIKKDRKLDKISENGHNILQYLERVVLATFVESFNSGDVFLKNIKILRAGDVVHW